MRVIASSIGPKHTNVDRVAGSNLHRWRGSAAGITLIELLVVISVITILMALLLPAVQYSREMARRFACQNNLHQLGLALHQYDDVHSAFPPGCIGDKAHKVSDQAWGWGVLILPYLEQRLVFDKVRPDANSLVDVLSSATLQPSLREPLQVFRCPSDSGEPQAHPFRLLEGFVLPAASATAAVQPGPADSELVVNRAGGIPLGYAAVMPDLPIIFGHPGPRPRRPGPTPSPVPPAPQPGGGAGVFGVPTARSNYVGSFGDAWQPNCGTGNPNEYRGNGAFGSFSNVGLRDLTDGSGSTFLVGERSRQSYAAVWTGVNSWGGFDTQGISMVMGTAAYPLNDVPNSYNLSCDGGGSAGFGSAHTAGAFFLFGDGSVRFVSDGIDFQSSPRGAYQRLACRNDGQVVSTP